MKKVLDPYSETGALAKVGKPRINREKSMAYYSFSTLMFQVTPKPSSRVWKKRLQKNVSWTEREREREREREKA